MRNRSTPKMYSVTIYSPSIHMTVFVEQNVALDQAWPGAVKKHHDCSPHDLHNSLYSKWWTEQETWLLFMSLDFFAIVKWRRAVQKISPFAVTMCMRDKREGEDKNEKIFIRESTIPLKSEGWPDDDDDDDNVSCERWGACNEEAEECLECSISLALGLRWAWRSRSTKAGIQQSFSNGEISRDAEVSETRACLKLDCWFWTFNTTLLQMRKARFTRDLLRVAGGLLVISADHLSPANPARHLGFHHMSPAHVSSHHSFMFFAYDGG